MHINATKNESQCIRQCNVALIAIQTIIRWSNFVHIGHMTLSCRQSSCCNDIWRSWSISFLRTPTLPVLDFTWVLWSRRMMMKKYATETDRLKYLHLDTSKMQHTKLGLWYSTVEHRCTLELVDFSFKSLPSLNHFLLDRLETVWFSSASVRSARLGAQVQFGSARRLA